MKLVALSGGIAAGKSTIARRFAELGAVHIDADQLAREVVAPGTEGLAEITAAFGDDLVNDEGKLDRKRLADIVFNNKESKHKLEAILHPRVRAEIDAYKSRFENHPYILIVIPLLLESEQPFEVDRILVVEAPEEIRIQRVQERDGRSPEQIRNIINSQVNDVQRRSAADDIIVNDNSLENLRQSVEKLNAKYTSITG